MGERLGVGLFQQTSQIQTFEETAMKKRRVEVNKSQMAFTDHMPVLNSLYFYFENFFIDMREREITICCSSGLCLYVP